MRTPIKLNKTFWPKFITNFLPSADDPRVLISNNVSGDHFSDAVSVFKFGKTFKSTQRARFPLTVDALKSLEFSRPPNVLDVGSSDGITSLHVMRNIEFAEYFITDLNPVAFYKTKGRGTFFFDAQQTCILRVSNHFVVYSDFEDSVWPLMFLAKRFFSNLPSTELLKSVVLINPQVQEIDGQVTVRKHNILEQWDSKPVELIIAANILNRSYFSDQQLLHAAEKLLDSLVTGGRLVVIDSRNIEKSTIFQLKENNKIVVEQDINGGTEIRSLLLSSYC